MSEKIDWRNSGLKVTIAGFVDAIAFIPILFWAFGPSLTRMWAAIFVIGVLSLLKRYGYDTSTIRRYLRSRVSRFFGGGVRPTSRNTSLFRSIDRTH